MKKYNHKKIEKYWQKEWKKEGVYKTSTASKKPTQYILDMFPYPSGEGLHVGHPKGYIATDIYSRFKRMNGYNVLHPMGWDAFGLPAENHAIKHKIHPKKAVRNNIKYFKKQLNQLGFDYDWSREINTTDPEYYKWTQRIFLQLYKEGLAYQSYEPINWCPSCKTGLANEDLDSDGTCERCGSDVEQKPMRQWVLKITDYADRLLSDLTDLDWPESVKESQRNWIGRSEGSRIEFSIASKNHYVLLHGFRGSPKTNFFPWLKRELEKQGHSVEIPDLPNPTDPNIEEQIEYVLTTCHFDENTVLLGHSLGGVVAQAVTERLKQKIKKLVLVASFTRPDFKDKQRPFASTFSWEFDFSKITNNTDRILILRDENDGVVPAIEADRLSEATGGEIYTHVAREEHFCNTREPAVLEALQSTITVFTTRPDTIYGATYMVLAPEHPLVDELRSQISNWKQVTSYREQARKKTELQRTSLDKSKTGVQLEQVTTSNPANGEEIPVFIADYVMMNYGTGAIMAVPAHDERDWVFAKQYNLPIRQVVRPVRIDQINPPQKKKATTERQMVHAIVWDPKQEKYLCLDWKDHPWRTFIVGGVEEKDQNLIESGRREVIEETGYKNLKLLRVIDTEVREEYFAAHKDENRVAFTKAVIFELENNEQESVAEEETAKHEPIWLSRQEIEQNFRCGALDVWLHALDNWNDAYTGDGELVNSGTFDGKTASRAKKQITRYAGGETTVSYKLKDWVFSRQRYWGEPIPVVHCQKCGVVPVPEKDLPVKLPNIDNYEPTGTGESPLASIDSWVNTKCPQCNSKAKRETNTMPQWAGSCWYYLRYIDPDNDKRIVAPADERHWMPVDMYVGGMEHATRHLIYARFWHKFLYDIGAVSETEPFKKLKNQGMIAGPDGQKMSKSKGNVINPDSIVERYGADPFRVYEMFMGPFEQGGLWSTDNLIGSRRFLERIWRLQERIEGHISSHDEKIRAALHKTIQKVTYDIEIFSFNTAISSMMVLTNELDKQSTVQKGDYAVLLKLLSPIAPHITEELWRGVLGYKSSIHTAAWPEYDPNAVIDERASIVIQINGKVRDEFEVDKDESKDSVIKQARERDTVKRWIGDSEIKKTIVVPGKLINFVI